MSERKKNIQFLLHDALCASVCLSVSDVEEPEYRLAYFKSNYTNNYLRSSEPQRRQSRSRGTPQNSDGIGVRSLLSAENLRKRGKIRPRLLVMTNGKSQMCFDWCQKPRPWMTLNRHYALCFKIHAFSEPTIKI